MPDELMNVRILLPDQIFTQEENIRSVAVETSEGTYGFMPHRLDCVAAIVPGILIYTNNSGKEFCAAVDEGVLVKTGYDISVSVRNAIAGTDLRQLRDAVEKEFLTLNEKEQTARAAMAKMEFDFIRRLMELSHE